VNGWLPTVQTLTEQLYFFGFYDSKRVTIRFTTEEHLAHGFFGMAGNKNKKLPIEELAVAIIPVMSLRTSKAIFLCA
jgi:hypothetical protein